MFPTFLLTNAKKKDLIPNIGLHDWFMTSKQTDPDLQFWLKTDNNKNVKYQEHEKRNT